MNEYISSIGVLTMLSPHVLSFRGDCCHPLRMDILPTVPGKFRKLTHHFLFQRLRSQLYLDWATNSLSRLKFEPPGAVWLIYFEREIVRCERDFNWVSVAVANNHSLTIAISGSECVPQSLAVIAQISRTLPSKERGGSPST